MCKDCTETYPNNTSFDNWLLHHKPHQEQHIHEINLLDSAITVILSYRINHFTVEEIMSHYDVSIERATEIQVVANRVISDIEDMLVTSMTFE